MAKNKKAKKSSGGASKKAKSAKRPSRIRAAATNPLVQEVVAAALVATAAALKDSRKARAMAEEAGDELEEMARVGSKKGQALWALALEVAQRAGDILVDSKKAKNKKR